MTETAASALAGEGELAPIRHAPVVTFIVRGLFVVVVVVGLLVGVAVYLGALMIGKRIVLSPATRQRFARLLSGRPAMPADGVDVSVAAMPVRPATTVRRGPPVRRVVPSVPAGERRRRTVARRG